MRLPPILGCRPLGLCTLFALAALLPTQAQDAGDLPVVTRTIALENARIVQAPGRTLERGTVVVRDGLIEAVGADVAVPFDARRIAADSLVVYAGFIDGLSHAAIPEPRETEREEVETPGDPPYDKAGIQPEREARDLLEPGDNSVGALRGAGFTVAHTVPHGRLLPGQGALILLAGDEAGDLVLRPGASLFAQWEAARGMYPATPMAIIATWRQLYREAERRRTATELYASNAAGLTRPPADAVHQAFFPVLAGERPVVFYAEDPLEAHRTLALQRELGFPLILAGLSNSADALDALQQSGQPVFLSLAVPDEPEDEEARPDTAGVGTDTTRAMTPDAPGSFFRTDLRTRTFADVEEEAENLRARRNLARDAALGFPAAVHEAGVPFGFATKDVKASDLLENVRLFVEHGLPADAALAALTTTPADVLGLSQSVGTIEPGKIANLVVTTGPLFEEDTDLRYVLVDGHLFEMDAEERSAPAEGLEPAGAWAYEVETPQGTFTGTITLSGPPADLEGTITSAMNPDEAMPLDDVVLSGAVLSFTFKNDQMGTISASVTLEGDTFEGTMTVGGMGGIPITGTRASDPDGR